MKTKILLIACFTTVTVQLFAQDKQQRLTNKPYDNPYTIDQYAEQLKKRDNIFTLPKGFTQSQINIEYLNEAFPSRFPINYLALQSGDKECLAVYNEPFAMTIIKFEDEEDPTEDSKRERAEHKRALYAKNLHRAYGRNIDIDDYLTVNSGEKAKEQFNVDSVYIFSIPLHNKNLKPYTYGVSISIMRYPSFIGAIHLLLTDEGYKHVDKYISLVERSVLCPEPPKNMLRVYKRQAEVPPIYNPKPQ